MFGPPAAVSASRQAQLSFLEPVARLDTSPLREMVRRNAQNVPGVYRMLGARGDVLYVGKSRTLRTRLLSYFRLPWPEHRHARMLRETANIEWDVMPNEFAALLREARLIRAHLPTYNKRGARPLDQWFVIVVRREPVPRLRVQRASTVAGSRAGAGATVIGPFAHRAPLVSAVRVLNDALGLRDCADRVPMVLRDAGDFFADDPRYTRTPGCHRYETRRCLGPCVAACSHDEYLTQLTRAQQFINGSSDDPQVALEQEMAVASAQLSYERAGWLRDRLAALETLNAQLARVREALSRPSFAYRVPGARGPDWLYLVREGRVVGDSSISDAVGVDRLLTLERKPVSRATALTVDALEELTLLEHWFRTRGEEQSRTASTVHELLQAL